MQPAPPSQRPAEPGRVIPVAVAVVLFATIAFLLFMYWKPQPLDHAPVQLSFTDQNGAPIGFFRIVPQEEKFRGWELQSDEVCAVEEINGEGAHIQFSTQMMPFDWGMTRSRRVTGRSETQLLGDLKSVFWDARAPMLGTGSMQGIYWERTGESITRIAGESLEGNRYLHPIQQDFMEFLNGGTLQLGIPDHRGFILSSYLLRVDGHNIDVDINFTDTKKGGHRRVLISNIADADGKRFRLEAEHR